MRTDGRMDKNIISDWSIMAAPYPRDWIRDVYICDMLWKTAEQEAERYKHDGQWCEPCLVFEDWMREIGKSSHLSHHETDKLYDKAVNTWKRMCPLQHTPTTHKGNGAPKGLFAGTLTMAPEWGKTEDDMVTAINKIFEQKTCPVKNYAWYVEQTENGTPHIHFIYETDTGGRIHQKVFKRYWEWDESVKYGKGHKGGYHKPVKSEIAYQEYIAKDEGRHGVKGFIPA